MLRPLIWVGIGSIGALLALTGGASAVITLQLTNEAVPGLGPQSTSNPCIIAGTTCQQPPTISYNNYKQTGNDTSFNEYSTNQGLGQQNGFQLDQGVQGTPYTIAQLLGLGLGSNLGIAIDTNTTGAAGENLTLFEILINGVQQYVFTSGPNTPGNIAAPPLNNGNGFGDYLLSGFNLNAWQPTDTVLFHAVWDHQSDGGESFFLVPGPLAGAGLPGLVMACGGLIALARRRRWQFA